MTYKCPFFPKPHPSKIDEWRGKRKINILSIDGGGIRGLIPALIIRRLEQASGRRVSDMFDLIAGTSTGGILALLAALPDSPGSTKPSGATTGAHLVDLYKLRGQEIFPPANPSSPAAASPATASRSGGGYASAGGSPSTVGNIAGGFLRSAKSVPGSVASSVGGVISSVAAVVSKPKHDEKGLEQIIREYTQCGGQELTVADTVVPVYISAVETENPWGPVFFSTLDARVDGGRNGCNYRLRDVARATSAAPTFLAPTRFRNVVKGGAGAGGLAEGNCELTCIDGGVCCNNPSLAAVNYVRSIVGPDVEVVVVSLGTGRTDEARTYDEMCGWGAAQWILPLIATMMQGTSQLSHDQLATVAAGDNQTRYHRFQVVIPPHLTKKAAEKDRQRGVACEAMDNTNAQNLRALELLMTDEYLPNVEEQMQKAVCDIRR